MPQLSETLLSYNWVVLSEACDSWYMKVFPLLILYQTSGLTKQIGLDTKDKTRQRDD